MCLFYLLELALSEHIGLPTSYAIAAAAVVIVVAGYSRAILASARRASALTGTLIALYGCLYMLLQVQDCAPLAGAIGLFLALAGIMYATRNVDWSAPALPRTE